MIMQNYVSNDLTFNLHHLSEVFYRAKNIINILDIENQSLINTFNSLVLHQNDEDYLPAGQDN